MMVWQIDLVVEEVGGGGESLGNLANMFAMDLLMLDWSALQ